MFSISKCSECSRFHIRLNHFFLFSFAFTRCFSLFGQSEFPFVCAPFFPFSHCAYFQNETSRQQRDERISIRIQKCIFPLCRVDAVVVVVVAIFRVGFGDASSSKAGEYDWNDYSWSSPLSLTVAAVVCTQTEPNQTRISTRCVALCVSVGSLSICVCLCVCMCSANSRHCLRIGARFVRVTQETKFKCKTEEHARRQRKCENHIPNVELCCVFPMSSLQRSATERTNEKLLYVLWTFLYRSVQKKTNPLRTMCCCCRPRRNRPSIHPSSCHRHRRSHPVLFCLLFLSRTFAEWRIGCCSSSVEWRTRRPPSSFPFHFASHIINKYNRLDIIVPLNDGDTRTQHIAIHTMRKRVKNIFASIRAVWLQFNATDAATNGNEEEEKILIPMTRTDNTSSRRFLYPLHRFDSFRSFSFSRFCFCHSFQSANRSSVDDETISIFFLAVIEASNWEAIIHELRTSKKQQIEASNKSGKNCWMKTKKNNNK